MSELLAPESSFKNLKNQIAVLDIVAKPCLNAAKEITALNTKVLKNVTYEAADATAAMARADWEPWARLVKGLGNINSPRAAEYAVALGQIMGAANTQMFVNASWAGLGVQSDTVLAATTFLPSLAHNFNASQPSALTGPIPP